MRIEIRSDSVVLQGYVNVTARESKQLSSPNGPFVEEILPKTFERALSSGRNVDLLFNHDRNRKLGSTQTGELKLLEDNIGLRATAIVKDEEIRSKAERGELRGWSFGFQTIRDRWRQHETGIQKRSVEELNLVEVSLLDISPAYVATSVEKRVEDTSVLTESRVEEDVAEIIKSDEINKTENSTETKIEEKRTEMPVTPEPHYYEHLTHDLLLLQLGGL
jgi:uncharacterized protein